MKIQKGFSEENPPEALQGMGKYLSYRYFLILLTKVSSQSSLPDLAFLVPEGECDAEIKVVSALERNELLAELY